MHSEAAHCRVHLNSPLCEKGVKTRCKREFLLKFVRHESSGDGSLALQDLFHQTCLPNSSLVQGSRNIAVPNFS